LYLVKSAAQEMLPEMDGLIVILYQARLLALQVQNTSSLWLGLLDIFDYTASMGFGGVFPGQDGINAGRHCGEATLTSI
jgi:hypothetical protein